MGFYKLTTKDRFQIYGEFLKGAYGRQLADKYDVDVRTIERAVAYVRKYVPMTEDMDALRDAIQQKRQALYDINHRLDEFVDSRSYEKEKSDDGERKERRWTSKDYLTYCRIVLTRRKIENDILELNGVIDVAKDRSATDEERKKLEALMSFIEGLLSGVDFRSDILVHAKQRLKEPLTIDSKAKKKR